MFYREEKNGITLFVRLCPKANQDAVAGIEHDTDGKAYLNIRVRAVREDGKANKALIMFLAGRMKIPKSALNLSRGTKSHFKQIYISGNYARLARLCDKISPVPAAS